MLHFFYQITKSVFGRLLIKRSSNMTSKDHQCILFSHSLYIEIIFFI